MIAFDLFLQLLNISIFGKININFQLLLYPNYSCMIYEDITDNFNKSKNKPWKEEKKWKFLTND